MNLSTIKKYSRHIILGVVILIVIATTLTILTAPNRNPDTSLTNAEKSFPEIPPQPFLSSENKETGILIVNSTPPGARVMIDGAEEAEGQGEPMIPVNVTPFKSTTIPIGPHNLTAFKQGHIPYSTPFDVSRDKITRIEIKLEPLPPDVGY